MVEFKKGDRVIVSGERPAHRNGLGVIENVGVSYHGVRLDNGWFTAAKTKNISYYEEVEMQVTPVPPQKIQQDGYEYELVGPVKPDWLVDGALVVSKGTGKKYKVKQVGNDSFMAESNDGSFNSVSISSSQFSEFYRPHTPEDFKWGDWAMYEGKRVFVIGRIDDGEIAVSYPNIDSSGYDEFDKNHDLVDLAKLTPTF